MEVIKYNENIKTPNLNKWNFESLILIYKEL